MLFSTTKTSDRINSLRHAESKLIEFAKTRFAHSNSNNHSYSLEVFDTPIAAPSVLGAHEKCQVFDDVDNYSIHGVKVTNEQLLAESAHAHAQQKTNLELEPAAPLVLLHGYASGSLNFYRNLHGLSTFFGHVYALDMLGWGLSSRPPFKVHNKNDNNDKNATSYVDESNNINNSKVKSAEQFFVESLESWRAHHDLPKMILVGHSMGAYLSVAYAERYPQHVDKLILLSPIGVPEKMDESRLDALPFYIRAMIRTLRSAFNRGLTPGCFLRSLPHSRSRGLVRRYIASRLPVITCEEEQQLLGEYLYQNSMLPGSGEDCLCEILTAGGAAKVPLIHRIPELQGWSEKEGVEVHVVYGENDVMDFRNGLDLQRICHQKQKVEESGTVNAKKRTPRPNVYVHGVCNAGHLLMVENYQEFNAAIAIAAGRGDNVPSWMSSRPISIVCDEVAADKSKLFRSSGQVVMNERDAAKFFKVKGGRFKKQRKDDNTVNSN